MLLDLSLKPSLPLPFAVQCEPPFSPLHLFGSVDLGQHGQDQL
jgi:hypothetical protein